MKPCVLLVTALLWPIQAAAQSWPAKPVRMVVPLSPGGFADVPARLLAPASMPSEIVRRLHAEIGKALQDPDLLTGLRAAGIAPNLKGPQELGAFMRAEHAKWGQVVRDTGATVN